MKKSFDDEQVLDAVRELRAQKAPHDDKTVLAFLKERHPNLGTPHPLTLSAQVARAGKVLDEETRLANAGRVRGEHRQRIRDYCQEFEAGVVDVVARITIDHEEMVDEMRKATAADAQARRKEISGLQSSLAEKEKALETARTTHQELLDRADAMKDELLETRGEVNGLRAALRAKGTRGKSSTPRTDSKRTRKPPSPDQGSGPEAPGS